MTAVDVDALDKLREAATAGPWDHHCCIVGADSGAVAQTFLARDGDLIVAMHNALPDLIAEVRRGRALREAVEGLHKPYGIYDECGHDHGEDDEGVVDVDDVGFVCDDGLMYRVCQHCCTTGKHFYDFQTEECVTQHSHGKDEPLCPTMAALAGLPS